MKRKSLVQILTLSVALIIGVYTIGSAIFNKETSAKTGSKAPDFTLLGLDGKVHTLGEYKGNPLVINFWGTFCKPCVREMPTLQKQKEVWQDKNVQIVGINLNENKITVKSFIEGINITFPILLDDDLIRNKYNVRSYPTTFFINANGIIEDIFIGEMQESDLLIRIQKIVKD